MNHLIRIAVATAVLSAAGAQAQGSDADRAVRTLDPAIMSDSEQLPAHDRDSSGAVVLRESPVPAAKAPMARTDAQRPPARDIGRNVRETLERSRTQVLGGPRMPARRIDEDED